MAVFIPWLAQGVTLTNMIIAGNLASAAANGPDVHGAIASQGVNLIGNTTAGSGFSNSDLLNVNPNLASLANNGGPTPTLNFAGSSPAIDAGGNSFAPVSDQRGFVRIVGSKIDIGALEAQSPNVSVSTTTLGVSNRAPSTGSRSR